MSDYIRWLDTLGMKDVGVVGGKNASLGEMLQHLAASSVTVPRGFATTASAYRDFLQQNGLHDRITKALADLDVDDIAKLTATGSQIRGWIMAAPFPPALEHIISESYHALEQKNGKDVAVAVRSSATAEDLPDASFAGQQETFLNVCGVWEVIRSVKRVYASLYHDRAIAYRVHHGFDHDSVALSAGIQQMVRSDIGTSGVMFTLDTESGFPDVVFITASYGLGETIVQGAVNPDEFYVYKPNLRAGKSAVLRRNRGDKAIQMILGDGQGGRYTKITQVAIQDRQRFSLEDADIEALARQALIIEEHYGRPMDIEWAKDGETGKLYIVQARPETVKSTGSRQLIKRYTLQEKSTVLTTGRSIGQKIGSGSARVVHNIREMEHVKSGEVLVADMTDPDWEPVMKRASAIVTNRGGRTCHAAIIARELGIPAVVGTNDATKRIKTGQVVTVSCAEGETGMVYMGELPFSVQQINLAAMPELPLKIMMNVGNPDRAFEFAQIPNHGVGLARVEFIINKMIGVHPKALMALSQMHTEVQAKIRERMAGYPDPQDFYVSKLAEGIAMIAAAFAPKPVIVRLSDFKSNEYANLLGGEQFEPKEENPMLGFRGAARYVADTFRPCFELECQAIHKVRDQLGFTNVEVMIPFVRTVSEAKTVVELLEQNGLVRGQQGLKLIMMCEIPSNALLADQFLEYFDGFSIGSNDLTQLTLGLDRDSSLVAETFDERDPAIKALLTMAIDACRRQGKYIGICGQGPSDHPDLAQWLQAQGIESLSLNPDTVVETWLMLAGEKAE